MIKKKSINFHGSGSITIAWDEERKIAFVAMGEEMGFLEYKGLNALIGGLLEIEKISRITENLPKGEEK